MSRKHVHVYTRGGGGDLLCVLPLEVLIDQVMYVHVHV